MIGPMASFCVEIPCNRKPLSVAQWSTALCSGLVHTSWSLLISVKSKPVSVIGFSHNKFKAQGLFPLNNRQVGGLCFFCFFTTSPPVNSDSLSHLAHPRYSRMHACTFLVNPSWLNSHNFGLLFCSSLFPNAELHSRCS